MIIGIVCQHRSGHTAYEQWLSVDKNINLQKEIDINMNEDSIDSYIQSLPQQSVVSFMSRPKIEMYLEKHKNIDWRILIRKDWYTQCLSFLYTNKTQIFHADQEQVVEVDTGLIDYFFSNYEIINNLKNKGQYPVYYYEDIKIPIFEKDKDQMRKNKNKYSRMIKNIDEVDYKIYEYNHRRM